jgi:hypothetical protein
MLHNPTSWGVTAIAWSKQFASAECARITDLQEGVTISEFGLKRRWGDVCCSAAVRG